jgi:hypothetical protein
VRTCRDVLCSNSKLSVKKGESCIVDCSTTFPRLCRETEVRNREEAANVRAFFELRFAENCARARPACVSALFALLKACESSLKKPSACTMRGAPRLNFVGGAAGCTCGIGIFCRGKAGELFSRIPRVQGWDLESGFHSMGQSASLTVFCLFEAPQPCETADKGALETLHGNLPANG